MTFQGQFFEPRNSKSTLVLLRPEENTLIIQGEGVNLSVSAQYCKFEAPISETHMIVILPDGARIEVAQARAFYQEIQRLGWTRKFSAFQLERSFKLFALSTIALAIVLFSVFKFVIPVSSGWIAKRISAKWANKLDEVILGQMDSLYAEPSNLSKDRQDELLRFFTEHGLKDYRILFRKSDALQANALALAGNTIIFTDALVNHVKNDLHLLGIAYHEAGHLQHRHSLRGLISATGFSLMTLLIGDLTGSPETLSSMGIVLVSRSFQRDQESEADVYAAESLEAQSLSAACFSEGLMALEEFYKAKMPNMDGMTSYFSTHPRSSERIQTIEKKYQTGAQPCGINPE